MRGGVVCWRVWQQDAFSRCTSEIEPPGAPPLCLLHAVMTGLAQALQVLGIPEQPLITTVRGLVVSDEQAGDCLYLLAEVAGE